MKIKPKSIWVTPSRIFYIKKHTWAQYVQIEIASLLFCAKNHTLKPSIQYKNVLININNSHIGYIYWFFYYYINKKFDTVDQQYKTGVNYQDE